MELDLRKQKKNKTIEPINKPIAKLIAENNDPLEITFDQRSNIQFTNNYV